MNLRRFRITLTAIAAVGLASALGWSSGIWDWPALAVASVSAALAIAAATLARAGEVSDRRDVRGATFVLCVGVALSLASHVLVLPGLYVDPRSLGWFRPVVAATALVLLSYTFRRAPRVVAALRFATVLALAGVLAALVIRGSPRPHIDTWHVERLSSLALTRGLNPYSVAYPNIYGAETNLYGPEILSPDRRYVLGNPYPPLTVLIGVPAAVLDFDVRWTMLALVLASAWAIRRLGRGSLPAELAAILLVLQPSGFFVLEQSWTEPTVLATFLLACVAVDRWRVDAASGIRSAGRAWVAAGLAAGLALASKQYTPLLLVPVLLASPSVNRWKAAGLACASAIAIALPFFVWDPAAFVRGVVTFQVQQPFRLDALSWPAALARLGGPIPPVWPAFVLAAATLGWTVRARVSLEQAILAAASAWLVFVLFNKQAFCNYYWLAVGLLCAGAARAFAQTSIASTTPSPQDHGR